MDVSLINAARAPSAHDPLTADCLGREIFNHMTSRWGLLILIALSSGTKRFHALRDQIDGISEKMLSQNLRTLTRDGLIRRTVEPTVPPKVYYELSEIGAEVATSLNEVVRWIGTRIDDIEREQAAFDRQSALLQN